MRKFIALFVLLVYASLLNAQITDVEDKIFISVLQPERDNIPTEAGEQLVNKLNQLLMQNGIANEDPSNRFVLTTKVSVMTKDIVPGPPSKVSMHLDFTFIIGDAEENKQFESATISTVGVGINENKAFIAAIKNIKPKNPELVELLTKAKREIVDYYTLRCCEIKASAVKEANARNYEKAIYMLMQIPDVADCAQECQDLAIKYSAEAVNNHAAALLNRARAVWASSPNADGATSAADIISQIPANTSSQNGINKLTSEINAKLKADERKAWEFKMRQYSDRIEKQKRDDAARLEQQRANNEYRERQQMANNEYRRTQQAANNEYRQTQQAADNAARRQYIEAARQIGIEYARNQPKSVTYQRNVILW